MVDKLIECTETVKKVKITSVGNENKHKHSSCTLYIVLFSIPFTINVGIATSFVYFHWNLKKDDSRIEFGTLT